MDAVRSPEPVGTVGRASTEQDPRSRPNAEGIRLHSTRPPAMRTVRCVAVFSGSRFRRGPIDPP
jgi:hypothetical protein